MPGNRLVLRQRRRKQLDFDFGNRIDSFFNGARLTVPIESDAY